MEGDFIVLQVYVPVKVDECFIEADSLVQADLKGGFKELLPPAYSDMGQTELQANVPDGGSKTLDFKLTSKRR